MAQHGTSQCRLCSAVQFSAVLCYATQRSTQRNTRRCATRPEVMRHCAAVYMYVQCARKSHLANRISWERSAQAGWRRACRGWSLRRRFLRGACQAQVSSANKANNKKKPGLGRRTEKCNGKRGHKREGVTAAYIRGCRGVPSIPAGSPQTPPRFLRRPGGEGGDGHVTMGGYAGVTCNAVSARGNALPSSSSSPSEGASSAPLMSPLREETPARRLRVGDFNLLKRPKSGRKLL